MKVEMQNNEIIVRFSASSNPNKIQQILDYLKFEELTAKSNYTENEVQGLVAEAKRGRWAKVKKDRKGEAIQNLEEAFNDVKLCEEGKKPLKSSKELLDEL